MHVLLVGMGYPISSNCVAAFARDWYRTEQEHLTHRRHIIQTDHDSHRFRHYTTAVNRERSSHSPNREQSSIRDRWGHVEWISRLSFAENRRNVLPIGCSAAT